MYLTRAFLDPTSRSVRNDIHNPESLHKTVMRAFPDDSGPSARATYGVLHRLDQEREERVVLLIQSRTRPAPERWPDGYVLRLNGDDVDPAFSRAATNPAIRDVQTEHAALRQGRRLSFRLRANTTKKIDTKSGPDGVRRNGRRVPLRGDDERMAWLARHGEAAGFAFEPPHVRITECRASGGHGGKSITVAGAVFEGVLEVRDAELFRAALASGIGPAKAYGFGLLSIAPVR